MGIDLQSNSYKYNMYRSRSALGKHEQHKHVQVQQVNSWKEPHWDDAIYLLKLEKNFGYKNWQQFDTTKWPSPPSANKNSFILPTK